MATRRYSVNPQDADYQVVQNVGAATVNKTIELTVDFDALTSAGVTGTQGKLQVLLALEKLHAFIEEQHVWPPA